MGFSDNEIEEYIRNENFDVVAIKIKDEEEYLLKMGDRQDFTINLTNMKHEEIESIVKRNLKMISKKLKLNLE